MLNGYLASAGVVIEGVDRPIRFSAITRKVYSRPEINDGMRQLVREIEFETIFQLQVSFSRFSTKST